MIANPLLSGFIADGIQIGLFFLSSFIAKMTLSEARTSMQQPKLSFLPVRYLRKYVIGRDLIPCYSDIVCKDRTFISNSLSFSLRMDVDEFRGSLLSAIGYHITLDFALCFTLKSTLRSTLRSNLNFTLSFPNFKWSIHSQFHF